MDLFQTTKDQRHYHLAVVEHNLSAGATTVAGSSKKSQHQHTLTRNPYSPQGGFVLLPGEDGHVHVLAPLERHKPVDTRSPLERVRDVRELYRHARALDRDLFKKGKESFDFVAGDIYTEAELRQFEADEQPPSAVNELEPKIDLLSGYQRQNRSDPRFFPVEGGDVTVADILTTLLKHDLEANLWEHRESAGFDDGAIAGRGLFQIRLDRSEDITGKVCFERYPWDGAALGPHNEPDGSDLEYLVKWKRYSLSKFKQLWPDKAKEVEATVYRLMHPKDALPPHPDGVPDDEPHTQTKPDQYATSTNDAAILSALDAERNEHIDVMKKDILVLELQQKRFERVPVLFNAQRDYYFNAEGVAKADLEAVARDLPGFDLVYRNVAKMWITVTAHDVLVEDGQAPPEMKDFSLVPFYAKKYGSRVWGKVEAAKYMVRQLSKLHRKFIDLIDKQGGYGWFSDQNTFANPSDATDFDRKRSQAGFHAKVADVMKPPQKVEGMKFPVELVEGIRLCSEKLREIMNIQAELLGMNSKAESGVAIESKKRQGLIGNEYLFDNFRLSKRLLAKRYLDMVPFAYTPKRIIRIIANIHQRTPLKLNGLQRFPDPMAMMAGPAGQPVPGLPDGAGAPAMNGTLTDGSPAGGAPETGQPPPMTGPMPLMPHHLEAIERILGEADFSLYDVALGESTTNPTTRSMNFEIALGLVERFPMIGPATLDLVIGMSDFPEKEEWIHRLRLLMAGTPSPDPGTTKPTNGAAPTGTPARAAA